MGLFHIGYEDCRGQSRQDAQFRNKWRRNIKGQLVTPGSSGKNGHENGACNV